MTEGDEELPLPAGEAKKIKVAHEEGATTVTIQIILGTYEKVLHGIAASMTSQAKGHPEQNLVDFADTFLLNAHTSAIRCLAVRSLRGNLFLSLPHFGSQDMFRNKEPFCSFCSCLISWGSSSRRYINFKMSAGLALLNKAFQVAENYTCQWQLRPNHQSLPLIYITTTKVWRPIRANSSRQYHQGESQESRARVSPTSQRWHKRFILPHAFEAFIRG